MSGNATVEIEKLKAAYLERFTRFVTWPADSDVGKFDKPFVLSVVGDNDFGEMLELIYQNQKILKKKVEIRYIDKIEHISGAHLLYIGNVNKEKLNRIIEYTAGKPILTVSHHKGFADLGVHINIYLEDNKLRFEINEKAVLQSGLKMSHLLMQRARIINPVME